MTTAAKSARTDYEPVPMETFFVLVCHYCGETVKDEGPTPGHVHVGEMEKHGHELPVFIPATVVEVNRRSDRIAREQELLDRLKAAEEALGQVAASPGPSTDATIILPHVAAALLTRMARDCEALAETYETVLGRQAAECELAKAKTLHEVAEYLMGAGRRHRDGIDAAIERFTEIRRRNDEIGGDNQLAHRIRDEVIPVLEQLRKGT